MKRNLFTATAIVLMALSVFLTPNAQAATATGMDVMLVVNDPVVIATHPADQAIELGDTATFTVVLNPSTTLPCDYQWLKNGTPITDGGRIAGATTATLTITACVAADAAAYSVTVNNVVNQPVTSNTAALSFTNQLTVTISSNPPASGGQVAINPGPASSITFTSNVTGNMGAVTYHWQKNGVNIIGAEGNSYTLGNPTSANNGVYTLVVADTSLATATSNSIELTVNVGITITQQPISRTVVAGQDATFTVGINPDATAPIAYQWEKDGTNLPGETSATLTIAGVTSADAGAYRVTVTNIVGSVTSNAAVLNVTGTLQVTTTTQPVYVDEQGVATVRINPDGGPEPNAMQYICTVTGGTPPYVNPAYTKDGVTFTGGTATVVGSVYTLTISNADNSDEGLYGFSIEDSAP